MVQFGNISPINWLGIGAIETTALGIVENKFSNKKNMVMIDNICFLALIISPV